jgi:hypothetical protein
MVINVFITLAEVGCGASAIGRTERAAGLSSRRFSARAIFDRAVTM